MIRRLAAAAAVLTLAVPPAGAASKEVERLQIQVAFLQSQIADLKRMSEDNVRELRRLNEALADQIANARKSQQDRRGLDEQVQSSLRDMSERLAELGEKFRALQAQGAIVSPPSGTPIEQPTTGGPPVAPVPGAAPPAPRELYSQAYADYARGNYDLAIQEYQEYLKNYPDTDFSDNAQYWIGECHYAKQRYDQAIEAWNALLRDYPSSDKLPDARFKKGLALEKLGRRSQALVEYRYVVDRYPNSDAGRKAREKLTP